ncbi:30S ribosomal protein S14 [Halovenus salina]|uniref:30S ribosomal protein S14 n=1 Tax=Halovenus salina TaxID=1510225 RepID=A0ABD5WA65_9EURY|nr:30S ribosomal protein S14 [Halovenus salina]
MSDEETTEDQEEQKRRVCPDTGREQGLVGKYGIWLCRQSFREKARDIGFEKYE